MYDVGGWRRNPVVYLAHSYCKAPSLTSPFDGRIAIIHTPSLCMHYWGIWNLTQVYFGSSPPPFQFQFMGKIKNFYLAGHRTHDLCVQGNDSASTPHGADQCIYIQYVYIYIYSMYVYILLRTTAHWETGPANQSLVSLSLVRTQRWRLTNPFKRDV